MAKTKNPTKFHPNQGLHILQQFLKQLSLYLNLSPRP